MFLPDFAFVTIEKNKSIAFMLPNHSGKVYKATINFPLHTMGHWSVIEKNLTNQGLEPIAEITVSPDGLCSPKILDNSLSITDGAKLQTALGKLLGLDFTKPLQDQKIGVVNKAIYFLGQPTVIRHCQALSAIQTDHRFISTMGALNVPSLPLPNVIDVDPIGDDNPSDQSSTDDQPNQGQDPLGDALPQTKAQYKAWLVQNNIPFRSKATLAELIDLYEEEATKADPVTV